MLQLRLEEATKTIQAERDEKTNLHKNIERLHSELQEAKDKCEDLKQAKQETVRELLSLQDQHRDTIQQIQSDLQDETSTRESVDRRMADLRAEVGIISAELQSYLLVCQIMVLYFCVTRLPVSFFCQVLLSLKHFNM